MIFIKGETQGFLKIPINYILHENKVETCGQALLALELYLIRGNIPFFFYYSCKFAAHSANLHFDR